MGQAVLTSLVAFPGETQPSLRPIDSLPRRERIDRDLGSLHFPRSEAGISLRH